jgi:hypothetical protein
VHCQKGQTTRWQLTPYLRNHMASEYINKLKVNLRLAINRFKTMQAKKSSLNISQRKEIASLLEKGKEEIARIRV